MKSTFLILLFTLSATGNNFIREKFRVKNPELKVHKPIRQTFGNYETVIGTCNQGSSLGIYRKKINQENELFYECNNTQAVFEEIFAVPGLNNDSLLDFGFILSREGIKQLYIIFSISERLYHYEMVQELQDGKTLAGPENKPPLELKYLKFYHLADVNNDGTPEFINNIFKKDDQLIEWPDISDTLDFKKIFRKSSASN